MPVPEKGPTFLKGIFSKYADLKESSSCCTCYGYGCRFYRLL